MRLSFTNLVLALPALIHAQITISTAPGYADQAWFKLSDETTTARPLAEWDLAFEINGGFSAGVLVNTAKGMRCYQSPFTVADWNVVDTAGMAAGWPVLHNSDTAWGIGALGHGISGEYDLGWGQYNMITHVVMGDSIYVLQLADGSWNKLRIDALAGGTYTFTYAGLDGSNTHTGSLDKADHPGVDFCYWSMTTHAAIDREPAASDWDLLFTKYVTDIGMWYGVTGVLQNKNVQVLQVNGLPPEEAAYTFDQPLATGINTIGYDWKYYDMGASAYVIDDSLTYFVKDVPGNIWKLVFTGFGGGTTGDITFTKEAVSALGLANDNEPQHRLLSAFPDPVTDGQVTLVLDGPSGNGILELFDGGGRSVLQRSIGHGEGLDRSMLDVRTLEPGLYTVQYRQDGTASAIRLAIQ